MKMMIRLLFMPVLIGLLPGMGACERTEPDGETVAPARKGRASVPVSLGEALSPTDTLRRVCEHRGSGQLELLEPYLLPEQRPQIIELIQSMDRLLWANDVLQAAVIRHFGRATARSFDRSQAANALGVFSRDVELFGERIEGDRAVVTIQVAGRVPLEKVTLVRRDGRWLIQTDPPVPGLAEALRDLAQALVDTARMLDDRGMSAIELQQELVSREASIGRRLEALLDRGA